MGAQTGSPVAAACTADLWAGARPAAGLPAGWGPL